MAGIFLVILRQGSHVIQYILWTVYGRISKPVAVVPVSESGICNRVGDEIIGSGEDTFFGNPQTASDDGEF